MDLFGMEIVANSMKQQDEAAGKLVDDLTFFMGEKMAETYELGFKNGMDLIIREIKNQAEKGYETKTIIESIESNASFIDLMKK